ncbi:TPA: ASCH domain-containing protein [Streptococcus suis]
MTRLDKLEKRFQTDDIWAFPDDYHFLYEFVKRGEKTATSSYYTEYAFKDKAIPKEKGYAILLNHSDRPTEALILHYPEVRIYPFKEVAKDVPPAEMMDEKMWFDIHERDFKTNAEQMGSVFSEDDLTLTKFMEVIEVVRIDEEWL